MVNKISHGIARLMLMIEKELVEISKKPDPQIEKLIEIFMSIHKLYSKRPIAEIPTIFFEGAGISGRRAKDLGTRFGQLGFLVGDPHDTRVANKDAVIFFSASATTDTTIRSFNRIRKSALKATFILITASPETEMAQLCNLVIQLPGRKDTKQENSPLSLLGANFESACDQFTTILVQKIREKIAESEELPIEKSSVSEVAMRKRHALI